MVTDRTRTVAAARLARKMFFPGAATLCAPQPSGTERDADASRRAPDHPAGLLKMVVGDDQHEVVGNAGLARHLQAGADGREIAHAAVDAAGAVERMEPPLMVRWRWTLRRSSMAQASCAHMSRSPPG
jgi:hypothetical protein